MSLHLLKLCVGVDSTADLEARIRERLALVRAAGEPIEHVHTTRMTPKRDAEIRAGGSLYWVIRGHVSARQAVRNLRPVTGTDGIGRCQIVLEPALVAVIPRPCRPFQGWRYLRDDDRPQDIDAGTDIGALPEHLRVALRDLCLL